MPNCRHFANLEDNMAEIWKQGKFHVYGDPDLLDNITEPTLYIQTLLARFRSHVDSGKDAKAFIKDKRCGCEPPCREHQLRLVSLSKGDKFESDNSPTVYSLKVCDFFKCLPFNLLKRQE